MQIINTNPMAGIMNTSAAQAGVKNAGTKSAGTKSAEVVNTGVDFSGQVMKCVSAGGQKVMLNADALMSYASPQTGESVNIYRSEQYTKDNPVYLIKGLDAKGNEFSYEVDASKINPGRCSYNELMVLNVETGGNTPENYLHAVAMRDKAGVSGYFEQADYLSAGKAALTDLRTVGAWDSYLSMDKWLGRIIAYAARETEELF